MSRRKKGKYIFPEYPDTSGSHVSQRRINKLKDAVIEILQKNESTILSAFKQLAKRYSKPPKVNLKIDIAVNKVRNAVVCREDEDDFGWCSEEKIWIPTTKMNDTFLLGLLLHESLHDCCTFGGKNICEKDEHHVMRLLGDDC